MPDRVARHSAASRSPRAPVGSPRGAAVAGAGLLQQELGVIEAGQT
ncbi:hypothetical protein [Candidatus Thiodictyon syntrophicum]|jgi:hypothetical protein|nr:hypothetical protein [Candidatus Thiodictyon syntrophicum]